MRAILLISVALCLGPFAQSASAAACASQGDPGATPIATDDPAVGGPLLVHLALWLSMLNQRDIDAQMAAVTEGCDRGAFRARRRDFALFGENSDEALPRVASARASGSPLAYLTPVVDFTSAMKPGHAGPAPISGYALMTALGGEHTAWRIYDAIPSNEALTRDMADALTQQIRPLMRWRDGKVEIIVPKESAAPSRPKPAPPAV